MFVLDEFGNWVFVPRGLCSAEGDGAEGGGGGEGDAQDGADKGAEGAQDGGADKEGADKGAGDGAAQGAVHQKDGGDKGKAEGASDDWRAAIADEKVRRHAERYPSAAALAEDAFKLRQKLSTAIVKPGKNASQEEVAAYRKAIGVPEAAKDYEIRVPDDLPEHLKPSKDGEGALNAFREQAHEAGLSQAQFEAMTEWYFKTVAAEEAAFEKRMETARERTEARLRKEMGKEYDANVELAARAAGHFGGEEFKQLIETVTLDGVRLGDHPTFLKTFAPIGRLLKEADPLIGMSDEQRGSLEEEHEKLTKAMHEARSKGDLTEAERLMTKRAAISQKIAGRAPALRGI